MQSRERSKSPSRSGGTTEARPEDSISWSEEDIQAAADRNYAELKEGQDRVGNPPINLEEVYAGNISDDTRQRRCVTYCRSLLDARGDDAPTDAVLKLALEDGHNKLHNKAGTYCDCNFSVSITLFPSLICIGSDARVQHMHVCLHCHISHYNRSAIPDLDAGVPGEVEQGGHGCPVGQQEGLSGDLRNAPQGSQGPGVGRVWQRLGKPPRWCAQARDDTFPWSPHGDIPSGKRGQG
jgi:hypothetical protein